jgi:signal recognition particle GTPase
MAPPRAASCLPSPSASVPIRFIGVGESIDDLRPFEPEEFLDALFGRSQP